MEPVNKQIERSRRTREALVAAARRRFGEDGYAAVSVEQVVRLAGLTRGALYHQFPDGKEALFRAVVEQVEEELIADIGATIASAGTDDPLEGLRLGMEAALDSSLDPAVARLTLIDAPAVLGWEGWRELGERYALGLVRTALGVAAEAGALRSRSVGTLAPVLLAAVEEASLMIARAEDRQRARAEAGEVLSTLLDGLRA
jgi:AcrR family transcriptional regulator